MHIFPVILSSFTGYWKQTWTGVISGDFRSFFVICPIQLGLENGFTKSKRITRRLPIYLWLSESDLIFASWAETSHVKLLISWLFIWTIYSKWFTVQKCIGPQRADILSSRIFSLDYLTILNRKKTKSLSLPLKIVFYSDFQCKNQTRVIFATENKDFLEKASKIDES